MTCLLVVDMTVRLNFGTSVSKVMLEVFFSCLASKASVLTISTPHPVSCLYQVSPSVLLAGSDKDIFVYDLLLNGK